MPLKFIQYVHMCRYGLTALPSYGEVLFYCGDFVYLCSLAYICTVSAVKLNAFPLKKKQYYC